MRRLVVLLALVCGCAGAAPAGPYFADADAITAGGIRVTTSGNVGLPLWDIDRIHGEFLVCAGLASLPPFEVLVPPPTLPDGGGWYDAAACGGPEVFRCSHGACPPPHPTLDPSCPCACTGYNQPNGVRPGVALVTVTPSLRSLSHELVHVLTRRGNHASMLFETCGSIR